MQIIEIKAAHADPGVYKDAGEEQRPGDPHMARGEPGLPCGVVTGRRQAEMHDGINNEATHVQRGHALQQPFRHAGVRTARGTHAPHRQTPVSATTANEAAKASQALRRAAGLLSPMPTSSSRW